MIRLTEENVHEISSLEKLSFSKPWSRQALIDTLKSPLTHYFGIRQEARLVGYGGIQIVLDEGYITNIAVDPTFRKIGVGSSILYAILDYSAELSFVTLEVRAGNIAAQKLYEKFGFTVSGIRPGYYDSPTEDAVIMTLNQAQPTL
ncbi:MAG: ribosomal protein S18-alanine N-acetyltransferase [Oscillospiraceae bacterium]|nr:ribosomal protein S18-alanine N-acetyltransferase [Oscillospiraceae bacterium]